MYQEHVPAPIPDDTLTSKSEVEMTPSCPVGRSTSGFADPER